MRNKIDWSEIVYKDVTGGGNDLTFGNTVVLLFEALVGVVTIYLAAFWAISKAIDWLWDKGGDFINWIKNRKSKKEEVEEN